MEDKEIKKVTAKSVEAAPQEETVTIEIPNGKVLVSPKDGSKPFIVNEATANKVFNDKSKFEIKKKQ